MRSTSSKTASLSTILLRLVLALTLSVGSLAYAGYCQQCAVTTSVYAGGTSTCTSPCGGGCTYTMMEDHYCDFPKKNRCKVSDIVPGSYPAYSATCALAGRGGCVCPTTSGTLTGSTPVAASETCVASFP